VVVSPLCSTKEKCNPESTEEEKNTKAAGLKTGEPPELQGQNRKTSIKPEREEERGGGTLHRFSRKMAS